MNDSYKNAFGSAPAPQTTAASTETVAYLGGLETSMLKKVHSTLDGTPAQADIEKAREMLKMMIDSGDDLG